MSTTSPAQTRHVRPAARAPRSRRSRTTALVVAFVSVLAVVVLGAPAAQAAPAPTVGCTFAPGRASCTLTSTTSRTDTTTGTTLAPLDGTTPSDFCVAALPGSTFYGTVNLGRDLGHATVTIKTVNTTTLSYAGASPIKGHKPFRITRTTTRTYSIDDGTLLCGYFDDDYVIKAYDAPYSFTR